MNTNKVKYLAAERLRLLKEGVARFFTRKKENKKA